MTCQTPEEITRQEKKRTDVFRVLVEDAFYVTLKNGHVVYTGPPPGSGVILAYILRILDGLLPTADAGVDAQRVVEAFKFAFGLRSLLGDPNFQDMAEVRRFVREDQEPNQTLVRPTPRVCRALSGRHE